MDDSDQYETSAEAQAYAECADVCGRLRARGDALSLEAAAHIEGSNQAFADLVSERSEQRERIADLQRNFDMVSALWAKVPGSVRIDVVHGKKGHTDVR